MSYATDYVWFLIVVDLLQCDKLTQRGDRLQFRVREFVLSINSLVNCYLHLANVVGNVILSEPKNAYGSLPLSATDIAK